MKGELLKALSGGGFLPGKPLKPDGLKKLFETWVEVYLAFHMIMSESPTVQAELDDMKNKLAEANDLITSLQCFKNILD